MYPAAESNPPSIPTSTIFPASPASSSCDANPYPRSRLDSRYRVSSSTRAGRAGSCENFQTSCRLLRSARFVTRSRGTASHYPRNSPVLQTNVGGVAQRDPFDSQLGGRDDRADALEIAKRGGPAQLERSRSHCALRASAPMCASRPRRAACRIAETAAQTMSSPWSAKSACPRAETPETRSRPSR